jgi:hypothetical protein
MESEYSELRNDLRGIKYRMEYGMYIKEEEIISAKEKINKLRQKLRIYNI